MHRHGFLCHAVTPTTAWHRIKRIGAFPRFTHRGTLAGLGYTGVMGMFGTDLAFSARTTIGDPWISEI
jgi:hypothetical protein